MFAAWLAIPLLLFADAHAQAQKQHYVSWHIYPGTQRTPAIQLPTKRGPWRLVAHDGSLIAEMAQPPLKEGYAFNFGECRIDGVVRNDLVAMVKHSKALEWSDDVLTVWIASPQARQFVIRNGSGTQCRNEGYGN